MTLRTINEISEAKRGVADQLEGAVAILRRPGADLDDVRDAMVPVVFARLTLLACEKAIGEAACGRDAARPCRDRMMAAAGDHSLDADETEPSGGRRSQGGLD